MYLCLCNAFTTRDVTAQVDNGCGSVASVYRGLGCRPRCGKCVADICQLIKDTVADRGSELAESAGAD